MYNIWNLCTIYEISSTKHWFLETLWSYDFGASSVGGTAGAHVAFAVAQLQPEAAPAG